MLRKPYVIGQYMFSNGVRAKAVSVLNTNGYLSGSLWTRPLPATATAAERRLAKGEAMFRGQCASCHTQDGYRSMKRLIGERDREGIGSVLKMLHDYDKDSPYRKYMPPLVGHPDEIDALGDYLASPTQKPQKSGSPLVSK
jgi:mono/diheme cytochrome c family protein